MKYDPGRWYRDAVWAASRHELEPEDALILLCFEKYSHDGKTSWVTRDTLQQECKFGSTDRGRRRIERLIQGGWLEPTGEVRNRSPIYWLQTPDGAHGEPDPIDNSKRDRAHGGKDGAHGEARSGTRWAEMGHTMSHESKDSGEARESVRAGARRSAEAPRRGRAPVCHDCGNRTDSAYHRNNCMRGAATVHPLITGPR